MSSTPQAWKLRIRHMLEAIAACREYAQGLTQQQLGANPRTVHAIAWNLIVIGAAARQVPDEVTGKCPEIPWAQMRGMRNHIVHGYDQIDLEIVWNVVTAELATVVPRLEQMLQSPE